MNQETIWYKYKEPQSFSITNYDIDSYEYRDFLLRKDGQYMYWSIFTLDNGKPPVPLRGAFTGKQMAKDQIDKFYEDEAKKQRESLIQEGMRVFKETQDKEAETAAKYE